MPDLITRLSALHAVLTSRLALQESLLNLSGRLDMALSQMETRSSNTPTAPATALKAKQQAVPHVVKRYVEGESEEEDDNDVEVEMNDDGGSLEDIELGGFDDMEEDEEEDEEEDSDESGPGLNGFIDDEAEEDYSEDEDEEDLSE
jgi:U3 small nucleolar RNA-associated protein 5